jgi:hypothetical protein
MSKCKVNQCYSRDCKYNKHDMCQRDSIIVKEDGTCAYYITEAKWKTHVLKD